MKTEPRVNARRVEKVEARQRLDLLPGGVFAQADHAFLLFAAAPTRPWIRVRPHGQQFNQRGGGAPQLRVQLRRDALHGG